MIDSILLALSIFIIFLVFSGEASYYHNKEKRSNFMLKGGFVELINKMDYTVDISFFFTKTWMRTGIIDCVGAGAIYMSAEVNNTFIVNWLERNRLRDVLLNGFVCRRIGSGSYSSSCGFKTTVEFEVISVPTCERYIRIS